MSDIERIGDDHDFAVVPPLCPLAVSPYDLTRAGEPTDRAAESTRRWLDEGGPPRRGIPHPLQAHTHQPSQR